MEAPVREVLALTRRLRGRGLPPQDLLAVIAGLKPLARCGLRPGERQAGALLARLARAAGLSARVYRSSREGGGRMALFGRAGPVKSFPLAIRSKDAGKMGRLLGYPACCVGTFLATASRHPAAVLSRSGPGPHSYLTNFLYNLHSRTPGPSRELERMLAGGYPAMEAYLLPWIPCRFDCAPSLDYAGRVAGLLAQVEPEMARALKEHLSMPVLWLDDWRFLPLGGARAEGSGCRYERALDSGTLLGPRAFALLARGNRLARERGGIAVFRGRSRLGGIPGALLFDFSG